jgi:hypothetical protein
MVPPLEVLTSRPSTTGKSTSRSGPLLVQLARPELSLLDPQALRKFGLVVPDLLDEALRVLASHENVDGVSELTGCNSLIRHFGHRLASNM